MSQHHSDIQSVVFFKSKGWNERDARTWLRQHNFHTRFGVDTSYPNQLRYRQVDPKEFKRFRTLPVRKDKMELILGYRS